MENDCLKSCSHQCLCPGIELRKSPRELPLEAVLVPEHGVEICARVPTESSVQTSAQAREPSRSAKSVLTRFDDTSPGSNKLFKVCCASSDITYLNFFKIKLITVE